MLYNLLRHTQSGFISLGVFVKSATVAGCYWLVFIQHSPKRIKSVGAVLHVMDLYHSPLEPFLTMLFN